MSWAYVNGNYIKVAYGRYVTHYREIIIPDFSPTASGKVFITTSEEPWWNVAAAAGWAMERRNGGMSGRTYQFYMQACPFTSPPAGSCVDNHIAYIDQSSNDNGAYDKYVIVHEMGHLVGEQANAGVGTRKDDSALEHGCPGDGTTGHKMSSREYQGQAANEGWAHYYAALAFNTTSDHNCWFYYYKSVDWNDDDNNDPAATNCEGGWMDLHLSAGETLEAEQDDWMDRDYLVEGCYAREGGELDNRGTEFDWLRFWWDFDTDQSRTFDNAVDIWGASDPECWYLDDTTSCPGSCTSCEAPATALRAAANSLGLLAPWDAEDDINGVHR